MVQSPVGLAFLQIEGKCQAPEQADQILTQDSRISPSTSTFPSPPIFTFLAPLASFRKRFVVREVQGRGEPLNGFQASSFFAHRRTHGLFFVCTVNCEGDHSPLISVRDRQQLHQLVRVQPASRIYLPPTPLQPQPQLDPYR